MSGGENSDCQISRLLIMNRDEGSRAADRRSSGSAECAERVDEVEVELASDSGPRSAEPARIHRFVVEPAAQQKPTDHLGLRVLIGDPAAHQVSSSSTRTVFGGSGREWCRRAQKPALVPAAEPQLLV